MSSVKRQRSKILPHAQLTRNAQIVLEKRYLWRDASGKVCETPEDLFWRVASFVSSLEKREGAQWRDRFFTLMSTRKFMPNTPTLINAGRRGGQLSACFVLPVEDSLDGIFQTLQHAARIHQSGGGTGFSFSDLRPKGSLVQSTHGIASGPVSFVKIFDVATETIKQGGARRGANMAILRVDHPDIFEFVDSKRDQKSMLNFNISVGVTEDFIFAVKNRTEFSLKDPRDGKEVRRISAIGLFEKITQAAWECGDPGLIFLDRIQQFNPTPHIGEMTSTNPCGEQPLLPYESCNLGSLNLGEYVERGVFDWQRFAEDVRVAVRFLDNVIELNTYPVVECKKITSRNRKIGLGVMGFADLLLFLGIPYHSEEAALLGEAIMAFLAREARSASAALAKTRGPFPNWKGSLWQKLGYPPLRNATLTTIAPTGTISMIAGASSGIEPIFSGVFFRNVLSGERLVEFHPSVERVLRDKGFNLDRVTESRIKEVVGEAWTPAQEVSVEAHVRMLAAFQRHSDSAVSKTINLPEQATPENVAEAYLRAYAWGCKGITIYRDKSRATQVLEKAEPEAYCPAC